jgi:hypothetical protein
MQGPLRDDGVFALPECQLPLNQNVFSIRWRGFIKPNFSEVTTFSLNSVGGAILIINDVSILNSSTINSPASATMYLRSNHYYSISVKYESEQDSPGVQLRWRSALFPEEVIPSSSFFSRHWLVENSIVRVARDCDYACMASGSVTFDVRASIATVGIPAFFNLKFNDVFVENSMIFSNPSFIASASSPNVEQVLFQRIDGLVSLSNTSASYLPASDRLGGLTASFYTDSHFRAPAAVASFGRSSFQLPSPFDAIDLAAQVDSSNASAPFIREHFVPLKGRNWSVRYAGWLLPSMPSEIYTISFEKPAGTQVSLFIDGIALLDAESSQNPSVTIVFPNASFVPTQILYSQTEFSSQSILKMMYKHRFMPAPAPFPSNHLCSLGLVHSVGFMPPLMKGPYDVSVGIVAPNSILLQSFSDETFSVLVASLPMPPFIAVGTGTAVFNFNPMNTTGCKSYRWTGYLKPESSSLTFQISLPSFIHTAAFFLDGSLVLLVDSAMSSRNQSVVHNVRDIQALLHFKFQFSSWERQFPGLNVTVMSLTVPRVFASLNFAAFSMDVNPSTPCASLSKVAVLTSSLLTAGVPFTAVLQIQDIYGNSIFDPLALVIALCPSQPPLYKCVAGNVSFSSYSAAHAVLEPSISGSSLLRAAWLQRGAWMASVTLESDGMQSNFTVQPGGTVGLQGNGRQTARFTGFVRVGPAFNVLFHLACSECSNATIVAAGPASSLLNSIASSLGPEYWYVEASALVSGSATASLMISSSSSPVVRTVSAAELHWLDDRVPPLQVSVQPGTACAARSVVTGATVATSGLQVSFSISALDEALNPTSALGRIWFMTLRNYTSNEKFSKPSLSSVLIPAVGRNHTSHYARVVLTASGQYSINVFLVERSGFHVDCFRNPYFDGAPVFSGIQTDSFLPQSIQNVQSAVFTTHIVSPNEAVEFSAHGNVTANLIIDGQSIVNDHCGLRGCFGRWTPSHEGLVVDLRLEVSSRFDIAMFNFNIITPSSLLTSTLMLASFSSVTQSPPVITVFPASVCATLSLLSGSGLVHATAGQYSAFQILPRDEFGNAAVSPAQNWIVRTRCRVSGASANVCSSQSSVAAPGPQSSSRSLSARYLITSTRPSYLSVSLFDAANAIHGLYATVYSDSSYSAILSNKIVSLNSSSAPHLRSRLNVPSNTSFTATFRGNFMLNTSSSCVASASHAGTSGPDFTVQFSVFIQGEKVIEASGPSSAAVVATGAFLVKSGNNFHDIDIFYSETCSPSCSDSSALIFSVSCASSSPSTILPDLFALSSVAASGVFDGVAHLSVYPAAPCAAKSFVFGSSFSLATAGISNYLSIRVLDAYSNSVEHSVAQLLGEFSLLCPTAKLDASITVFLSTGSDVTVRYSPKVAGSHDYAISVSGSTWLSGIISVVPASASVTASSVSYVSLATAGVTSMFSILLRDSSGNIARHTTSTAVVCSLSSASQSEHHSIPVSIIPSDPVLASSPPETPASYSCSYRVTSSGQYSASVLLATAGGIMASSSPESSVIAEGASVIDASSLSVFVSSQIDKGVSLNSRFRFAGYIKPVVSGLYTFQISGNPIASSSAAIRLWFDDEWIFDSAIGRYSASVSLDTGVLYEIYIEFTTNRAFIDDFALEWSHSGASMTHIPTSALFTANHVSSSPFLISVEPHATCGSMSFASSPGVSLATSGIATVFTLTARDHLGNRRFSSDDEFVLNSNVFNANTGKFAYVPGSASALGHGLYACSFPSATAALPPGRQVDTSVSSTATDPPFMDVLIAQAVDGGLSATYYNSVPKFSSRSSVSRTLLPTGVASNYEAKFSGFLGLRHQEASGCIIHVPASATMLAGSVFNGQLAASVDVVGPQVISINFTHESRFVNVTCFMQNLTSSNQAHFNITLMVSSLNTPVAPIEFTRIDFGLDTFYGSGLWATYYSSTSQQMAAEIQPGVSWPSDSAASSAVYAGTVVSTDASGGMFYMEIATNANSTLTLWLDGYLAVNTSNGTVSAVSYPVPKLKQVINFILHFASSALQKNLSVSFKFLSSCSDDRNSPFANASCISRFAALPLQPLSSAHLSLTQSSCSVSSDDSSSFSWAPAALLRSSALRQPRARGSGKWSCSAMRIAVLAGSSDAESTIVNGLVTVATAGTSFTFVVALRDTSHNALNSTEPLLARASVASSWATADFQLPSFNRSVSFTAQKAGTGYFELGLLAQAGNGVAVCTSATPTGPPTCHTQVNLVDFPASNFAAQSKFTAWSGFLTVEKSGTYQIYISSHVVVNFSIDGAIFSCPAGSTFDLPPVANVPLRAFNAHAFQFNFTRAGAGQPLVSVMFGSGSLAKQHLSPSALYPSFRRIIPQFAFEVHPGPLCASTSAAQPLASIATAGVPLGFQIHARDEFGNMRHVQDDTNADCVSASACKFSAYIHASLASDLVYVFGSVAPQTYSPTFTGTVTPTASITHTFAAGLLFTGGLSATFYRTPEFFDPFAVWHATAAVMNATVASRLNGPLKSVRWRGFMSLSSSCSATFLISSANPFRIVVDSAELISNNLGAFSTATAFIATSRIFSAAQLAEVFIEYADVMTPGADFHVQFVDCSGAGSNMTTTPSVAFMSYAYMPVLNGAIFTHAAAPCASTSVTSGAGLTVMSAGSPATFSILIKDSFGNLATSLDPSLVIARALSCGVASHSPCSELSDYAFSTATSSCSGCPPATDASISAQTEPSRLSVSLTLNVAGLYRIEALLLQPNAALATTFQSCSFDSLITSYSPQSFMSHLVTACVSSASSNVQSIAVTRNASAASHSRHVVIVNGFLRQPTSWGSSCAVQIDASGDGGSWLWLAGSWLLSPPHTHAQFDFALAPPLVEFYFVASPAASSGNYSSAVRWSCGAPAAPFPPSHIFLKQPFNQNDSLRRAVITSASTILRTPSPHGLSPYDPVVFHGSALPEPLSPATVYYVIRDSLLPNEFRVSTQRRNGTALAVAASLQPLFFYRAFSFGSSSGPLSDKNLALRPIDTFAANDRVPVRVIGAPPPLFLQPRFVMATPAPGGRGYVQLRYLNNVPALSFEITRLVFLVPVAMQLTVVLPVSACASLSTIISGNGNGNFWTLTAGSPAHFIVTLRDALSNVISGLTTPWDIVPFYSLNGAQDLMVGSVACEATGQAPGDTFQYVLRAVMMQAGNYTIGLNVRSAASSVLAASTTVGCVASVACAALSAVSFNRAPPAAAHSTAVQVAISSFDAFGNARGAEDRFSACTAHVSASAVVSAGELLSVSIRPQACRCCASAHVVVAGGPAISSSPAAVHPVFDFVTGMLASAAVTSHSSLATASSGYVVQPPVSVLTSALPLLKVQLLDAASASLWPGQGRNGAARLAVIQGAWNATAKQHVFTFNIPPASLVKNKLIRAEAFQLLHGALLATYYRLRAHVAKTSVDLSDEGDAVPCMTAAAHAPLSHFQGRSFPNLECSGSLIGNYAVRYHGFVRRSSAAALTFLLPETRPATFFSIYIDQKPLPVALYDDTQTWATGSTLPSHTVTAVIPPPDDGSMLHEVAVSVRGAPLTWPPPIPLFLETECRHAISVVSAAAGVFTTADAHALVGGEAVVFDGGNISPPLATGSLFYVLEDSISWNRFSVASSRLGTASVAAQWSGGTVLVLGKCGVYAALAQGSDVLHERQT